VFQYSARLLVEMEVSIVAQRVVSQRELALEESLLALALERTELAFV
jgi:hypothetical protein